ncbi:DUF305 domain-containing protein [Gordonia sp. CPCC 205515]|uniref:DUF305 domain-containing protein n=1 Tax=Gordonia sp. CPCC 205515 TaxID=3140791 RepID=UPI003AF34664
MNTHRPTHALIALAASAALLSACSSTDDTTTTPTSASASVSTSGVASSAHNQADVTFLTMMIPHHQQAIEMADLVPTRTDNPEVTALAARIKAAQQPEIDQMTQQLAAWGVDAPDSGEHDMSGHGSMPGMMTDDEMAAMRDATGATFDRLWLEGMIRHHEGAIGMANAELADGQDPTTKALANRIKLDQTAEIAQMKKILGQ